MSRIRFSTTRKHNFSTHLLLLLVVRASLDLSLGLELGNDVLVLSSDLVGETAD